MQLFMIFDNINNLNGDLVVCLVVSMSAFHAKGPGFDPHRLHDLSSKKSTVSPN